MRLAKRFSSTLPFSQRREKKCPLEKRLIRRLAATVCYGSVPVSAQDVSPFWCQLALGVFVQPWLWNECLLQPTSQVVHAWIESRQQWDRSSQISSRSNGVQINGGSIPRSRQARSIFGRFSGFAICLQFHVSKNCIP